MRYSDKRRIIDEGYQELNTVRHTVEVYGDSRLMDYFDAMPFEYNDSMLEDREDLCKAVYEYLMPILGTDIAENTCSDIKRFPVLLTANHHGIEYFAQSVQGNLIYYCYRLHNDTKCSTIPVFAGSGIPMCNASFPRGILVYDTEDNLDKEIPLKIPIFPEKYYRCMVSHAMPFNETMVKNRINDLEKNIYSQKLSYNTKSNIKRILEKCYLNEGVLGETSYAKQCVKVNYLLGQEMFKNIEYNDIKEQPALVYIELEENSVKIAI